MAIEITSNEELPIHIIPRDSKGNVARVDGPPVWTVSDETVIELAPGADEFGKVVRPKGPVGAALVTCTVDADLGEGVRHLTGQLTVTVLPGEAATLAINAGEATPMTPAPAPEPAPAVEEQPAADPVSTETSASEANTEVTTEPAVADVVADPVTEEAPAEPAQRQPGEMRTEQSAADPVTEQQPAAEQAKPAAEASQEDGDTPAG